LGCQEGELFLARDRLGIKPLYYALGKDQTLYFGSEQKALLCTNKIDRVIDAAAFHDLFSLGFIYNSKTLFRDIHSLPAGHYALYRQGSLHVQQYWDLTFACAKKGARGGAKRRSDADWALALREQLQEVVTLHMRSDVPIGVWLSGGLDSSSILALLQRVSPVPANTFSLVFNDHPKQNEFSSQKLLHDFFSSRISHHAVPVQSNHFDLLSHAIWHQENPIYSANHILQLLLAQATGQKNKVVLTGEGADELFGGYDWYRLNKISRFSSVVPLCLWRGVLNATGLSKRQTRTTNSLLAPRSMNELRYAALLSVYGKEGRHESLFSDHWQDRLRQNRDRSASFSDREGFDEWGSFQQLQYIEAKTRLVDYNLQITDRASMAASVEARVPFLDHKLVEFCALMPPTIKMKYLKEKYILRKAVADLLPAQIVQRKKKGLFAPLSEWLRDSTSEHITHFLSQETVRKKGYFNPAFVDSLYTKHRTRQGDFSRVLMMVLNVQIWDELFLNGSRSV